MAYLGRTELKSSDIQLKASVTISGTSTDNVVLAWTAPNEQSLILKVNGVVQHTDAYSIAGSPTTITLASGNFADGAAVEVVGINDIGTAIVPADGSVTVLKLADDAVTEGKLATTGTPDGSKFLQDDMAWTTVDSLPSQTSQSGKFLTTDGSAASWAAAGGKILQFVEQDTASTISSTTTTYITTGLSLTITPSATTSVILLQLNGGRCYHSVAAGDVYSTFYVDSGSGAAEVSPVGPYELTEADTFLGKTPHSSTCVHEPATTSALTYYVYYKGSSPGTTTWNETARVWLTAMEIGI